MALVRVRRAEVLRRVELVELVLRYIAEISGLAEPGHSLRERVVRVQLILVRITSLEGDGKAGVTRAPVRLRHSNSGEWRGRTEGRNQLSRVRRKLRGQQARWIRGIALCVNQWPDARVDVKRSEFVQAEDVNIVELQRHVFANLLREANVPLLRVRRLEVWIEHPAARARQRVVERARDRGR